METKRCYCLVCEGNALASYDYVGGYTFQGARGVSLMSCFICNKQLYDEFEGKPAEIISDLPFLRTIRGEHLLCVTLWTST